MTPNFDDLPEHQRPTDAELQMGVEAATGKPYRPESLEQGVADMQARIDFLEQQKAALTAQLRKMDTDYVNQGNLQISLAELEAELQTAYARRDDYKSQLPHQN